MSESISATFTFIGDGVFHFSRRIPKKQNSHNTSPHIAYSLRTRLAKDADARARKAADQLDNDWFHVKSRVAELPEKHMLRLRNSSSTEVETYPPVSSSSSVLLSEAVKNYLQQNGWGLRATFSRAFPKVVCV
jgi:hypothetical protein